jgi:hypothetical protein
MDNIDEWLKMVSRREPVDLTSVDRRLLGDLMKHPVVLEAWRRAVESSEGEMDRLRTLNSLNPEEAAESLRIQGRGQALVMLAETFWEIVDAK